MAVTQTEWVFDDSDRDKVFECLNIIFGITFNRVKNYKKYRHGSDGNYYCVIGGYQNWHGIPREAIDKESSNPDTGYLVYAKRHQDKIELYMGKVKPFMEYRNNLSFSRKSQAYVFHVIDGPNIVRVKEAEDCRLKKIYKVSYFGFKRRDKKKLHETIKKLTREQLAEINKIIEGT